MKLLVCLECGDIFSLREIVRTCICGESSGSYINSLSAEIKGNCKAIGFANDSFKTAYKMQQIDDKAQVGTDSCCFGVEFIAFFIPETANSVNRVNQ